MAKVDVLIDGVLMAENDGHFWPTTTLIRSNQHNIIVDPGTAGLERIEKGLAEHSLAIEDIDMVFLTHSHFDHYKHVANFKNATALDYWGFWQDDTVKPYHEGDLGPDIRLLNTPGHSYDSLTMIAETDDGVIAVCGDLIFKQGMEQRHDDGAGSQSELQQYRDKILAMSKYIIPGHGEKYEVKT